MHMYIHTYIYCIYTNHIDSYSPPIHTDWRPFCAGPSIGKSMLYDHGSNPTTAREYNWRCTHTHIHSYVHVCVYMCVYKDKETLRRILRIVLVWTPPKMGQCMHFGVVCSQEILVTGSVSGPRLLVLFVCLEILQVHKTPPNCNDHRVCVWRMYVYACVCACTDRRCYVRANYLDLRFVRPCFFHHYIRPAALLVRFQPRSLKIFACC